MEILFIVFFFFKPFEQPTKLSDITNKCANLSEGIWDVFTGNNDNGTDNHGVQRAASHTLVESQTRKTGGRFLSNDKDINKDVVK